MLRRESDLEKRSCTEIHMGNQVELGSVETILLQSKMNDFASHSAVGNDFDFFDFYF